MDFPIQLVEDAHQLNETPINDVTTSGEVIVSSEQQQHIPLQSRLLYPTSPDPMDYSRHHVPVLTDDEFSSDSDSDIEPDLPPGLDGAAFQSRLPANKLTKQEMDFFPDVAGGSQSAIMEFLFIRNKLLQAWLMDPFNELTPDKAQTIIHLPHPGLFRSSCFHTHNSIPMISFP
jgi:lysine-specific histone demethylase 1